MDPRLRSSGAGKLLEAGEGRRCFVQGRQRRQFVHLDVRDEASWDEAMTQVVTALGGLDILVNNAGMEVTSLLIDFDPEDLSRMLEVNCIYPGLIGNPIGMKLATDVVEIGLFPHMETAVGSVVRLTPLGHLGQQTDMANAVVFLAAWTRYRDTAEEAAVSMALEEPSFKRVRSRTSPGGDRRKTVTVIHARWFHYGPTHCEGNATSPVSPTVCWTIG